jgi:hypothetical protein
MDAIRAGIIKGTLLEGFASASSIGPKRSAGSIGESSCRPELSFPYVPRGAGRNGPSSPALRRLNVVFRQYRLTSCQRRPLRNVKVYFMPSAGRYGRLIDHMRFNLVAFVRAEQRVVHDIAVVARDIGGRPDRIKNFSSACGTKRRAAVPPGCGLMVPEVS